VHVLEHYSVGAFFFFLVSVDLRLFYCNGFGDIPIGISSFRLNFNLVVGEGFCFILWFCNLFQQLETLRDRGDIPYVDRRGFWGVCRAGIVLTFGVVGFH
jgi:hypothetical protein